MSERRGHLRASLHCWLLKGSRCSVAWRAVAANTPTSLPPSLHDPSNLCTLPDACAVKRCASSSSLMGVSYSYQAIDSSNQNWCVECSFALPR